MAKKFKVEKMYQDYLKRVNLDENRMAEVQKTETKRAFYGGFGTLLAMLHDDIPNLSDSDAFNELESMTKQVANFYLTETHKQN